MSRTARLGAFILGTLALLVLGIFIIGSKKYLFTSTYTLRAGFANVAGLSTGADVRVGGVHVGTVRLIELPHKAGDSVTVLMDMNTSTHEIVKQDSIANIETEGLLGNQYIAITFGSPGQPEVKSGDTIASAPPLEMSALLVKANSLLDTSNDAVKNITAATASLQSVSAKIDRGDGTVGALINNRDVYDSLQQTAASAQKIAISAQAGVVDFQENMEALKHNFLLRGYFKSRGYEDSSEIGKDEIAGLPIAVTTKEFSFEATDMFDKQDSAEIKNQKALNSAGEFLASDDFGVAVVEVSSGMLGDADSDMVLARARAMVIRDYLVDHYSFDDSRLKTFAIGRQNNVGAKDGWGVIKVVVYPTGTLMPAGIAPADTPVVEQSPAQKLATEPVAAAVPPQ